MVAMAKERLAREWQQGEVDPFDLKLPYEPVAEPVRAPRPSQRPTPRTATHLTPLSNQL